MNSEPFGSLKTGADKEAAKQVGLLVAERAKAAGIEAVVFDRGGYLYHGRVKALTDAARAAGLNKDEVVAEEPAAVEETAAPEPEAKPKKARVKKEKSGKE